MPQPTASRHLAYLRKSGLVEARRDGIWMHYRLAPIDNPVVAAVVKAALHALTHTAISAKDEQATAASRCKAVVITVLFACVHNAGRSQIAAALFNQLRRSDEGPGHFGGHASGRSRPSRSRRPRCRRAALTFGATPQKLTPELASTANWLITMGCGDECPVVPGAQRDDWPIHDPKGQSTRPSTRSRMTSTRACVDSSVVSGWPNSRRPVLLQRVVQFAAELAIEFLAVGAADVDGNGTGPT